MNSPAHRRRRFRPAAGSDPVGGGRRRTLLNLLARQAARVRSGPALLKSSGKALLRTLVAVVAIAPLAAAWGIGHAEVDDYLGPHQVRFATNYGGEVEINLGPIGNAYLPSPAWPVGVTIIVGGVGAAPETVGSLFSERTLAAYASLYTDPQGAVEGIVERLEQQAVVSGLMVEALLLVVFAAFRLRSRLLAPWVVQRVTRRRVLVAYATVVALVLGSILAPRAQPGLRIPVSVAAGTGPLASLTVDSVLLADLLDRGIKGITLLSDRQQQAVRDYVDNSYANLSTQFDALPRPSAGESMIMGFSDLHCNQATTELITRLVRATEPALVLSSGDDTVNGTAAERGCIRREAAIAGDLPFLVAPGNHDSNITETQMSSDGMTVLDGKGVAAGGMLVLGDDDPEHNIPFSVERTMDRPESEEQLGQRLVDVARTERTDVIMVHQPRASAVIMDAPDPPARLVLWGHFHAESGPSVVRHADGSWTVGMQQGTAGGVRQPTFTSFSTPFSPPLISADVYFYFRDTATGLITGVQPVHFRPDASAVVDDRMPTGDLDSLPVTTRIKLGGDSPSSTPIPATPSPR